MYLSFIGLFDQMILLADFIHLIKREGGYTYSSLYGFAFFKDKSFVCKPTGTFLQWHRCSAEQKRRKENESRMKEEEKASGKVFR